MALVLLLLLLLPRQSLEQQSPILQSLFALLGQTPVLVVLASSTLLENTFATATAFPTTAVVNRTKV